MCAWGSAKSCAVTPGTACAPAEWDCAGVPSIPRVHGSVNGPPAGRRARHRDRLERGQPQSSSTRVRERRRPRPRQRRHPTGSPTRPAARPAPPAAPSKHTAWSCHQPRVPLRIREPLFGFGAGDSGACRYGRRPIWASSDTVVAGSAAVRGDNAETFGVFAERGADEREHVPQARRGRGSRSFLRPSVAPRGAFHGLGEFPGPREPVDAGHQPLVVSVWEPITPWFSTRS